MEIDLNEIIISGTINNVTDNNNDYIKFGLTTLKYDKRKVYASFNINRNLYEIYKDFQSVDKVSILFSFSKIYCIIRLRDKTLF